MTLTCRQAGATADIDPGVLQYSSEAVADAFKWETFAEFVAGAGSDAERTQAIRNSLAQPTTAAARSQLLTAFDMQTATVNVTAAAADDGTAAPQVLGAFGAVGEVRQQLRGRQVARERREPHLQPCRGGVLAGDGQPGGVAA